MANANPSRLLMAHPASPIYGKTSGVGVVRDATETAQDGVVAVSNGDVAMCLDPALLCEVFEDFLGAGDLPKTGDTVVNASSPWFIKDTSAAGAPTIGLSADAANGQLGVAFASTNEVEAVTLYWNDEQNISTSAEPVMIIRAQIDTLFSGATVGFVAGFASAQNDTVDSVAQNAWVKVEGANLNLLLESDDATTDTDDKDSGVDLVAGTMYEFKVSMSALDGASYNNVKYFYRSTLGGDWTELTFPGTTFKVLAGQSVQPYFSFYKNSAGTDSMKIDYVRCYWKRS